MTNSNFDEFKRANAYAHTAKLSQLMCFQPFSHRYVRARIAYNVFNMDRKVVFIAKLPLILGGFFELG